MRVLIGRIVDDRLRIEYHNIRKIAFRDPSPIFEAKFLLAFFLSCSQMVKATSPG